jgi:PAS domain S-box-containing protein
MRLQKKEFSADILGAIPLSNVRKQLRIIQPTPFDRMSVEELWSHPAKVLENISEAVIYADSYLRVINWNKAAERIYGWKKEEVLNRNLISIIQPDSRQFDLKTVASQLRQDGFWKKELNSYHKDGHLVYVASTVYLTFNANNQFNGVFVINHDITHQKLAEQALQQNEKRFRTLVQNSSDVIVVMKADGIRSYTSPSIEPMLGRSPQDFTTRDFMEYVHPDDLTDTRAAFSSIMQIPDLPVKSELRLQHSNGTWVYVECVLSNQLNEPSVEGIVINIRNISKTKQAEHRLENSEARLRALMQYSSDITAIIRTDGTISYLSPSIEHILGYPAAELQELPFFTLINPDDLPATGEQFTQVSRQSGTSAHMEFRVKHKFTGKWVYLECFCSNHANDPSVGGIIANMRNITDRKESETRLNQVLDELERRNHELDHYVYKVSHDLRAPLCSILGLSGLIKTENDLDTIKQYNGLIENSVNKLDHFIQSILNHSRTLNTQLNISRISFKKIINDCFEELKYLPNSDRMQVGISIHKKGDFYSDAFRISILFKNFISNSIKYLNPSLDHNFIHFDISIADQLAQITIRDNGIGIDRKYVSRIFDMFFRATEKSNGSGLGLYIVKQTVQKLGGTINVSSESSKGTTFTLMLPDLSGAGKPPRANA